MKKSILIPIIAILLLLNTSLATAFWTDILILKWDQDESADVSGYVVKVKMTRPDGRVINYEHRIGNVGEHQLDVVRDGQHEIEVVPVNGAGSRLDPVFELDFVPRGIPRD